MLVEGMIMGNNPAAIEYGELSLQIAREHDLREQLAFTLHDLTRRYLAQGSPEQSIASAEEARQLWLELDNQTMLGNNYTMTADVYHLLGEFDQAIELGQKGLQISQSIGSNWGQGFSYAFLAEVYFEIGQFDAGFDAIQEALVKGHQAQFASIYLGSLHSLLAWMLQLVGETEKAFEAARNANELLPVLAQAVLASLHYRSGDLQEAEEYVDEVIRNLDEVRRYPVPEAMPLTVTIFGEVAIDLGKTDLLHGLMDEARNTLHQIKTQLYLADLLYLEAMLHAREGRNEEAASTLIQAEEIARKMGSRRPLLKILPKRIEMETALGNLDRAEEARTQFNELVAWITKYLSSDEMRQSFLETDIVKILRA
jgi:tetratricopeptide (TPR) repeat protein